MSQPRHYLALCAAWVSLALPLAPASAQSVGTMGQPIGSGAPGSASPRPGGAVSVTTTQPSAPAQFGTAQPRPPMRVTGPMQPYPIAAPPAGWTNAPGNAPAGWRNAPGNAPAGWTNGTNARGNYPSNWPGTGLRPIGPVTQNGPINGASAPVTRVFNGPTVTGTVTYGPSRPVRVTTPLGPQTLPNNVYNPYPVYGNGGGVNIVTGGPVLLGGYYYGNYCDNGFGPYAFPAIYSGYDGFPQYIYSPGVIVLSQPYYPAYETGYLPFNAPTYPVTYNENNYYVSSPQTADDIEQGGETARHALKSAAPEGSYQAAFGDIERAWQDGNMGLLSRHLRDNDTKLSVFLKGKYSYSIAASDFTQITRDAFWPPANGFVPVHPPAKSEERRCNRLRQARLPCPRWQRRRRPAGRRRGSLQHRWPRAV